MSIPVPTHRRLLSHETVTYTDQVRSRFGRRWTHPQATVGQIVGDRTAYEFRRALNLDDLTEGCAEGFRWCLFEEGQNESTQALMMWQGPGGTIHPAANADNTVFTYQSNYNHRVGGTRDGCAGMVVPLHRDCGCDCEWRDKYQSLLQQLQQVLQQRSPP